MSLHHHSRSLSSNPPIILLPNIDDGLIRAPLRSHNIRTYVHWRRGDIELVPCEVCYKLFIAMLIASDILIKTAPATVWVANWLTLAPPHLILSCIDSSIRSTAQLLTWLYYNLNNSIVGAEGSNMSLAHPQIWPRLRIYCICRFNLTADNT